MNWWTNHRSESKSPGKFIRDETVDVDHPSRKMTRG